MHKTLVNMVKASCPYIFLSGALIMFLAPIAFHSNILTYGQFTMLGWLCLTCCLTSATMPWNIIRSGKDFQVAGSVGFLSAGIFILIARYLIIVLLKHHHLFPKHFVTGVLGLIVIAAIGAVIHMAAEKVITRMLSCPGTKEGDADEDKPPDNPASDIQII